MASLAMRCPAAADTSPPDDSRWLISLGIGVYLLMVFSILTVSGDPSGAQPTPEERFRANVQPAWGFPAGGVRAAQPAPFARADRGSGLLSRTRRWSRPQASVIQDPRKVPEQLQIRRGAIYAGDRVVAASEVITPSRYVHRIYPEPTCRTWRATITRPFMAQQGWKPRLTTTCRAGRRSTRCLCSRGLCSIARPLATTST